MKHISTAEKERRRERAYHSACESQYIAAAARLTDPRHIAKALENAAWHSKKVTALDAHKA